MPQPVAREAVPLGVLGIASFTSMAAMRACDALLCGVVLAPHRRGR